MTTKTKNPTLESLGLKCTIVHNGIEAMDKTDRATSGNPMLKWNALFTNERGHSEQFDYYTGIGCGPQPGEQWLWQHYPAVASVPKNNRWNISDKMLLARIAATVAFNKNWKPDAIEILWAIARDGDALESTFEDWCSELGYETDSRKAEGIYRACQNNALRLRKILSADKIQTIKEIEL